MQKVNTFLHIFRHSLYPIDFYYKKVRKNTSMMFSLKYLTALIFSLTTLLVLISVIAFAQTYPPNTLKAYTTTAFESYPQDLVISINENGRLVTNYDRPYTLFIPMPETPTAIFVIDTKANAAKISQYETNLLLTEREMVVKWDNQTFTMPYEKNNPLTIDSVRVKEINTRVRQLIDSYPIVLLSVFIIGSIVLTILFLVSKLAYLALISIFVFAVGKLIIKKLELKKTYQIALHATTGPILIEYSIAALGIKIPVSIWFLIITVIFISAAVYEAYIAPNKMQS